MAISLLRHKAKTSIQQRDWLAKKFALLLKLSTFIFLLMIILRSPELHMERGKNMGMVKLEETFCHLEIKF